MKKRCYIIIGFLNALLFGQFAVGASPTFNSITCRSYDYYQLGGDRKVLEISISKDLEGKYRAAVARAYEAKEEDRTYTERNRIIEIELAKLTCTQAPVAIDSKVITCATGGGGGENYINISRIDHTLMMSAFASSPGKVGKTTTYDINVYSIKSGEYSGFTPENCILH